jgi:hypothetical protein
MHGKQTCGDIKRYNNKKAHNSQKQLIYLLCAGLCHFSLLSIIKTSAGSFYAFDEIKAQNRLRLKSKE